MNFELEVAYSQADVIKQVDALKQQIDAMRPLLPDVEGRVMQKLRLDWNYNSNAIEGNKLNYGETVAFLMTGITAKGKPLKDHLDIRGHNEAINFLLSIVKDTRPITESDIRALHEMILVEPYEVKAQTSDGSPTTKRITLGEYKTSPNHVQTATGEIHYYTTPEETPAKMQELMEWYHAATQDKEIHPLVIAARFHHKFVAIHPFDDGNGRLSRILMNLILMQNGYPPAVIKMDDRQNYYALLSQADVGDNWPFIEYITERVQNSLQLYLKAAKGESIDEDEDIDKEIALFKIEVKPKIFNHEKKSMEVIYGCIQDTITPLVKYIFSKAQQFDEFFLSNSRYICLRFNRSSKTERFTDINTNFYNFIRSRNEDIREIELQYRYKGFRNPESKFDVFTSQVIVFSDYQYKVLSSSEDIIVSKYYDEQPTMAEKADVVRALIKDIKGMMQYGINKKPKA
jgi:Fic family protein